MSVSIDGSGNGAIYPLNSATAQASTSGTFVDFTGIPSWVKRITVSYSGISSSASTGWLAVQIGSGSVDTAGYSASVTYSASSNTVGGGVLTNGFALTSAIVSTAATDGVFVLSLIGSNTWAGFGSARHTTALGMYNGAGSKSLSGVLDRVRFTWHDGSTFDAGLVNILYE